MLVDTHCHLDFNAFDKDRSEVIDRAILNDIKLMLVPAIDIESCGKILHLVDQYPNLLAAVGVHPNHAGLWHPCWVDDLRRNANHSKVAAIGEIGLDYYWTRTPKNIQRLALEAQLNLASEMQKPAILHSRESISDLINILISWVGELSNKKSNLVDCPGVLHSFSGTLAEANQVIEYNFMIGITGPVTFSNAKSIQEVVTYIPLDHLVIETDSPFLTPHPYRGKRNEPSYVTLVAEKIAVLKNISIEEVAMQTTVNARRLLNWREKV
jgi:TatD DNase family protein